MIAIQTIETLYAQLELHFNTYSMSSCRSTKSSFSKMANLVLLPEWPDRKPRDVLVVGSQLY